jgi:hypothetical protein
MNREVHVRFWERPGVKVLRATRQSRRATILSWQLRPIPKLWLELLSGSLKLIYKYASPKLPSVAGPKKGEAAN